MKMAMQPCPPGQMLVAALLPGTYTWLKTGSAATEWEPAAVATLAFIVSVRGLVNDAEYRTARVVRPGKEVMVVAGIVPNFVVTVQTR